MCLPWGLQPESPPHLHVTDATGWPTACICGDQQQSQRLETIRQLRQLQLRVLVSTDLTSRGVDLEHVTLVLHLDVPRDLATYMHRVGRTGRFGE